MGTSTCLVMAPPSIGLPWGKCPLLLLCWLATEAVRTRSPVSSSGRISPPSCGSLAKCAPAAGGGPSLDSGTRRNAFSSTIRCSYTGPGRFEDTGFVVASRVSLWWNPAAPEQPDLFGSFVELLPDFFQAILDRPIPVDLRVLLALRSPLALDIYCWLTYRAAYLRRPTEIPWSALALQFGASLAYHRRSGDGLWERKTG